MVPISKQECTKCLSFNVIKKGKRGFFHRYKCKNCENNFQDRYRGSVVNVLMKQLNNFNTLIFNM